MFGVCHGGIAGRADQHGQGEGATMNHHRNWRRAVRGIIASTIVVLNLGTSGPAEGGSTSTCFGRQATIVGSAGDDELAGTQAQDVIMGRGGNDRIRGRGGEDLICGGAGQDDIEGNGGRDRLSGDDGNDRIEGGKLWDRIHGGAANDVAIGGMGPDTILAGFGDDLLKGGRNRDQLAGGLGDDRMNGGPAGDIVGFFGVATTVDVDLVLGVATGQGNDTLADVENVVVHGSGTASVIGDAGPNYINLAMEGGGTVTAGGGNDDVDGGPGDDVIDAGDGNDQVRDTVMTIFDDHGGADQVQAGAGNDDVDLTDDVSGNDSVDGGGDSDSCLADVGDAVINCE
jgi:Ca2+-binding RTX toxin-like protein